MKQKIIVFKMKNKPYLRYLSGFLTFLLLVFLCFSCQNSSTPPSNNDTAISSHSPAALNQISPLPESCALGYVALAIEKEANLTIPENAVARLDSFCARVKNIRIKKQTLNPNDTNQIYRIEILTAIEHQIAQFRQKTVTYHPAFGMCLAYGFFDCDINTILYLTAADTLGLPLEALLLPNHTAIVWPTTTDTLYWETTTAQRTNKNYYLKKYLKNTADTTCAGCFTLLNRQQLIALLWFNVGKTYADAGHTHLAEIWLTKAISVWPSWFLPRLELNKICGTNHYQ
jgi:hypothetical protein